MLAEGRGAKMPCESCAVQFSVFKRKRVCSECERYYCSGCLRRGGGAMCAPCRVLSTRPLSRNTIAHLKVRDLQCFLHRQNVSTRGCVEKDELVSLCVSHVNSAQYRRRGAGAGRGSGAFSSLKGFTNNINDFINSAFDLRTAHPAHPPPPTCQTSNCFNSTHIHSPTSTEAPQPRRPAQHERFTPTPGGERDIRPAAPPSAPESSTPSSGSDRVETADCFEIEDLDDAGWEFVTRPADPLPNDSEVLLSATESRHQSEPRPSEEPPPPREQPARPERHSTPSTRSVGSDFERIPDLRNQRPTISRDYLTPGLSSNELSPGLHRARASSELELRAAAAGDDSADTNSLQDEPLHSHTQPSEEESVSLEGMSSAAQLERLSVKQLKQLLVRNRVEFRGCIERAELLERAKLLYREHALYRAAEELPIEDSCKICMAAPLECVLLECGHIAACTACSKQLAECPICRQYVVRAVRFFRS